MLFIGRSVFPVLLRMLGTGSICWEDLPVSLGSFSEQLYEQFHSLCGGGGDAFNVTVWCHGSQSNGIQRMTVSVSTPLKSA